MGSTDAALLLRDGTCSAVHVAGAGELVTKLIDSELALDDRETAEQLGAGITHLAGGNIHQYRRMIHHMDEGIGWIVEALRKNGQLDNTLIVFTSDNGGERFS